MSYTGINCPTQKASHMTERIAAKKKKKVHITISLYRLTYIGEGLDKQSCFNASQENGKKKKKKNEEN